MFHFVTARAGEARARQLRASVLALPLLALVGAAPCWSACDLTLVAAGGSHCLAGRADDTVWAWGDNLRGQLGVALPAGQQETAVPVEILALRGRGTQALAAGFEFSMALAGDGSVWTWGRNQYGQLGHGTTVDVPLPRQVTGLTDVVTIAAGLYHCLAVKADGTLWAWGLNASGQLGDGRGGTNSSRPVRVGGSGFSAIVVVAVAAGGAHSMALAANGSLWAWGDDSYGQLGPIAGGRTDLPDALWMTQMIGIAAGEFHSLGIRPDGSVWGWGDDVWGQLGNGPGSGSWSTPVPVAGLPGPATALAAGQLHSMARLADGRLFAWGFAGRGALGADSTDDALTATEVVGIGTAQGIACGSQHSLAVLQDGGILAWGLTHAGELGDGRIGHAKFPVPLGSTVTRVTGLSTGFLAIAPDATPLAWGFNQHGELGTLTTLFEDSPTTVPMATDVTGVAGAAHALALRGDTTLLAWGRNSQGQLGNGGTVDSLGPIPVLDAGDPSGYLSGVVGIAAGRGHSLAVKADGSCWGWGSNQAGTLGQPLGSNYLEPIRIPDPAGSLGWLEDVESVAAGASWSMALKTDGTLWAFGNNGYGQLGDGTTTARTRPGRVGTLSGVTASVASTYHCMALLSDGSVWTWGRNSSGQLGDATTTTRLVPVAARVGAPCVAIAAGFAFSLALTDDGHVLAWGDGYSGQLGNGNRFGDLTPALVLDPLDPSGLLSDVVEIAATSATAIARKADGSLCSWGAIARANSAWVSSAIQRRPWQCSCRARAMGTPMEFSMAVTTAPTWPTPSRRMRTRMAGATSATPARTMRPTLAPASPSCATAVSRLAASRATLRS